MEVNQSGSNNNQHVGDKNYYGDVLSTEDNLPNRVCYYESFWLTIFHIVSIPLIGLGLVRMLFLNEPNYIIVMLGFFILLGYISFGKIILAKYFFKSNLVIYEDRIITKDYSYNFEDIFNLKKVEERMIRISHKGLTKDKFLEFSRTQCADAFEFYWRNYKKREI